MSSCLEDLSIGGREETYLCALGMTGIFKPGKPRLSMPRRSPDRMSGLGLQGGSQGVEIRFDDWR